MAPQKTWSYHPFQQSSTRHLGQDTIQLIFPPIGGVWLTIMAPWTTFPQIQDFGINKAHDATIPARAQSQKFTLWFVLYAYLVDPIGIVAFPLVGLNVGAKAAKQEDRTEGEQKSEPQHNTKFLQLYNTIVLGISISTHALMR